MREDSSFCMIACFFLNVCMLRYARSHALALSVILRPEIFGRLV